LNIIKNYLLVMMGQAGMFNTLLGQYCVDG